jgi:hypothetical protein
MTDHERLSRLLDGDLDPDAERLLRARFAAEPALAASWARMQDLARDLDGLTEPVPAGLDDAVLGSGPRSTWARVIGGALMLVAVALLWVGRGSAPDGQVALLEGTHRLEGHVDALAGVVPLVVDGVAVVTVEPSPGSVRARGIEEEPMTRTAVVSALAGAAITIAVYEGRASLARADGPPLVVEAGQRVSVVGPELRPRPSVGLPAMDGVDERRPPDELSALRAENLDLRQRLAEASFSGAVARGQLEAVEGRPVPWPDDAPAGMRPEVYESSLRALLEGQPGAELSAIDCTEYPCVAVITGVGEAGLAEVPKALIEQVAAGLPVGLAELAAKREDGPDAPVSLAFVIMPGDEQGVPPELATRSEHRARRLLEEVGEP